jgi:ribose transport system permease protein
MEGSQLLARMRRRLAGGLTGSTPIMLVLAVTFVLAAVLVPIFGGGGDFLSVANIRQIFVRSVSLGIVAVGQTLVIIAGSIDLSVAYTVSVAAVLASFIMQGDPSRMLLAVVAVLGVGAGIGVLNGLVVTKLRVNPLMATLGTGLVMQGFLNASFSNFAGSVPEEFQILGYARIGAVPLSVLLLLVVAAAAGFLLQRTRFGAHLYAIGGDREIARLSGIRADRVVIVAHLLCSVCAALTGLYIVSRLRAGAPWVGPDGGYDLESIAAVVMGGTALLGGRGGVAGTVAGVLILAMIDSVFNLLEFGGFLKEVMRGLVIIVAVAAYTFRRTRAKATAGTRTAEAPA